MHKKSILFDFAHQDPFFRNSLSFVEGAIKVLQEIALELNTLKGTMPDDREYGSFIKGMLNSSNLSFETIENEAKRIAHKHPAVEYAEAKTVEKQVILRIKVFDAWGGETESTIVY